jgi:hypothetical protein
MGSIRKAIAINAAPDDVWAAVRDFGAVHTRLVRGFVVDARLDSDTRIVTFASGTVQREPLVACDAELRRLVYTVEDSPMHATHYNASVQVLARGAHASTVEWVIDFLPDSLHERLDAAMNLGAHAMKTTLEEA